ncbi:sensor histidine kinase [Limosilactobacillus fastidiosus]|uniref:histidine kinase n=1 Tax=Limosilactobacillus fastidiosus TaxID=2759855 RepID=A0A7W3TZA4_9LACO|nr:sensor histidine kinase [Limosilactobacillus fastidiosus]MBB1062667.1 sensor histidine kinase [Limosilactobacillus fastidiosus]MBB1085765.1 sensor histidine kinase [Limosilactobacillus fastidiosus]MCD7083963.1 sensor histidine kinase [Limosilactobacillus fastidiosus]MCD7085898.1 sensor histidine kinase [Limosilactobacillus fastidiosus]MCD7113975.1 sensor histidine kinase [Limosilactobacillus fastidiosus]
MKSKKFWTYQFKSFLPIFIFYLLLLGLIKLLATLYYLPKSFFWDTFRFSFPLLVIWFLVNSYQSHKRVQVITKEKGISVNNPIEAQLLHNYQLHQRTAECTIHDLNNQQKEQLDRIEMYSHEIKNSLTSLQAATENSDPVPSKTVLRAVFQANYHLDMLLNDERLAMTKNDLDFEWINLQKLIIEILKQNSSLFISRQLVPQLDNLSNILVLTDRKWLRFCINQLLSNAIKYSPNDSTIYFNWVNNNLQIIDHGIGIKSSDLPRIYDNGFSGKNGHQTIKSTGMGLYLVKKISSQLNFSLKISSKAGHGTNANLHFPGNNVKKG